MFKVIVAGGRDFNNYKGLSDSLDYLLKNINMDIKLSTSLPTGISMGSPLGSNGM